MGPNPLIGLDIRLGKPVGLANRCWYRSSPWHPAVAASIRSMAQRDSLGWDGSVARAKPRPSPVGPLPGRQDQSVGGGDPDGPEPPPHHHLLDARATSSGVVHRTLHHLPGKFSLVQQQQALSSQTTAFFRPISLTSFTTGTGPRLRQMGNQIFNDTEKGSFPAPHHLRHLLVVRESWKSPRLG